MYVVEKNTIRKQPVVLGAHIGTTFEIVSGLKGDETLATTNLSELATGVRVAVGRGGANPSNEGDSPARRGRPERGGRQK